MYCVCSYEPKTLELFIQFVFRSGAPDYGKFTVRSGIREVYKRSSLREIDFKVLTKLDVIRIGLLDPAR